MLDFDSLIPENIELFENIPHHVWFVLNSKKNIVYFNKYWQSFTGLYGKSKISSQRLYSVIHPEDLTGFLMAWKLAEQKIIHLNIQVRLKSSKNTWQWFQVTAKPVVKNDEITHWIGTNTDIDNQVKLLIKYKKIYQQRYLLQETSFELNNIYTILGACSYFTQKIYQIFNNQSIKISSLVGSKYLKIIVIEGIKSSACRPETIWMTRENSPTALVLQTQKPVILDTTHANQADIDYLHRNNLLTILLLPIVTQDGVFGEIQLGFAKQSAEEIMEEMDLFLSISQILAHTIERIQLVEKLRAFNLDLEQQVIARTDELRNRTIELEAFVFSASHDLRAPLSVLLAASRRIKEQSATNSQLTRIADSVQTAAVRMNEMLNVMLELARGQSSLLIGQVELQSMLQQVFDSLEADIELRQVKIELNLASPSVFFAESELYQVLQNLVQNAVKFAGKNQEAPWIQIVSMAFESGTWLEITNNTNPIAPESSRRLFDLFYTTNTQDGMGIGLHIVKQIIERNHARIWLEVEPDFRVCLFFPNR